MQTNRGELIRRTLPALEGEKYIFHVFTPALVHRLDPKNKGSDLPVIAVRSSLDGYNSFVLVHELRVLGPSELIEEFSNPLPGTMGRGVCFCITGHAVEVTHHNKQRAVIQCGNRDPSDILVDVLREYA